MLGFGPISSTPISAQLRWSGYIGTESELIVGDAATKIYAATVPFITRVDDDPVNTPFDGTLEATLRIDRSITGTDGYAGFSQSISEFSLINADGNYDDLTSAISVNGQEIICSLGTMEGRDTVDAYHNFIPFAVLTGERFKVDRNRVTFETQDPALHLATETVQQTVYAGTGDLEGTSDLEGKRVPFVDGVVFNITPTLVIPGELLWQVNDGAVGAITSVKDGGVALTFAGDYATVALLRAAGLAPSPDITPPGSYSTCIADGYFLTGGSSFGQITADVTGVRLTTADIIQNVALTAAMLTAAGLDASSFSDLNTAQPATVGYYLDSESSETCVDMFTKLMTGIGGWHGMTALGLLQVRRFEAPVAIAAAYYNTSGGNIVDIDRTALPAGVDPPPHRRRVIYGRNWTVMTNVLGAVSEGNPALADYLTKPYLVAATTAAQGQTILNNYPDAPDPDPVEAYFASSTDAAAEALRLYTLYASSLTAYRFTLKNALFVHQVGEVVNVVDSRLNLSAGRYLRLVEVSDDTSSMSTECVGFG